MFNNQPFSGWELAAGTHYLISKFADFCDINTPTMANWFQATKVSAGGAGKKHTQLTLRLGTSWLHHNSAYKETLSTVSGTK